MPLPATRLSGFSESVIRGMTRLANKHNAINLAQGFPDFDPPEELLTALERATRGPFHQYAVTWGTPRFRQALARKISHFTGFAVDPDQHLVVTCGSTEAMMVAMMTACRLLSEAVIVPPRTWEAGCQRQDSFSNAYYFSGGVVYCRLDYLGKSGKNFLEIYNLLTYPLTLATFHEEIKIPLYIWQIPIHF